jgi:hypothetical protein
VAPTLQPVDLKALADQLPDLSNLDNLTVNIQTNTFIPPQTTSNQLTALAQNTEARLGHLRSEIKHALEQGTATITERFDMLGRWC